MTTLEELKKVLYENRGKRISVVGTSCTGKTTLLKDIPEGIAMSELAPPLSNRETKFYYDETLPHTREVWHKKNALRADKAIVKPDQPVFGTAIASNAELVVYFVIDDRLLAQRAKKRGASFKNVKMMQEFLEHDITERALPVIRVEVKE